MLGSQVPTDLCVPEYAASYGDDAIEIAEMAGLILDPYQREVLTAGLGVIEEPSTLANDYGELVERWAAFEVGIELSRQNGKSCIFEARALAGLYVFREQLIVYSAHKGETALGAFSRIEQLIRNDPELLGEVKPNGFKRTNGKEAIELITGQMIKFRTRTAGGGRGLSGDCVILDEAQDLTDDHTAALMPVLSARPNPQLWYGGSAGTKKSVVQGRLVRRCTQRDAKLVYYRWAAADDCDRSDPKVAARVNPAAGRRISFDFIAAERRAMSPEKYDRERLGIGDYPRAEGEEWAIPQRAWDAAEDEKSEPVGSVVFSVEVRYGRAGASISIAGRRRDGGVHLETICNDVGTQWTVESLKQASKAHKNLGVVINAASPAISLVGPLRDAGLTVHLLKSEDLSIAFGEIYDGIMVPEGAKPTHHHGGGTILTSALAEAQTRDVGDGRTTWRTTSTADVTAILSATWAGRGLTLLEKEKPPPPSPRKAGAGQRRTRSRGTADLATASF